MATQRIPIVLEPTDIVDALNLTEGTRYEIQATIGSRGGVVRAAAGTKPDVDGPAFYHQDHQRWIITVGDQPIWFWTTASDVTVSVNEIGVAAAKPVIPPVTPPVTPPTKVWTPEELATLRRSRAAGTWGDPVLLSDGETTPSAVTSSAAGVVYFAGRRQQKIYRLTADNTWENYTAWPADETYIVGLGVKADGTLVAIGRVSRAVWEYPVGGPWARVISVTAAENNLTGGGLTSDGDYFAAGIGSNAIYVHDSDTDTWSKVADLPDEIGTRTCVAADVAGGFLFSDYPDDDMQAYDGTSWYDVADEPTTRPAAVGTKPDGALLFIVGSGLRERSLPAVVDPIPAQRAALRIGRAAGTWTEIGHVPTSGTSGLADPIDWYTTPDGDIYLLEGSGNTIVHYPAAATTSFQRPSDSGTLRILDRAWKVGSTRAAGSTHLRLITDLRRRDTTNPGWTLTTDFTITINGNEYKPAADTASSYTPDGLWFVIIRTDRPATGTDFTEDTPVTLSIPGDYYNSAIACPAAEANPVGVAVKADGTIVVLGRSTRAIWERNPTTFVWAQTASVRPVEGGQGESLTLDADENYVITGGRSDTITRYDGTDWNKVADKPAGFSGTLNINTDLTGDILFSSDGNADILAHDGSTWIAQASRPLRGAVSANGIVGRNADGDLLFLDRIVNTVQRLVPG